jgi:hypothetical protein
MSCREEPVRRDEGADPRPVQVRVTLDLHAADTGDRALDRLAMLVHRVAELVAARECPA